MRRVFLYLTTSMDGFIAGPDNELDWMLPAADAELTRDIVDLMSRADAGFLGYPVAVGMLPYWRSMAANPDASPDSLAIANAVNRLHSIVLSRTEETLDWDNSRLEVVRDDAELVDLVTRTKQEPGGDLGVPGGVRTAQTFARLKLIDEYVFLVHPVAIGEGKRVFTGRTDLSLVGSKTYDSGIIQARYRPRD
jgi:dihydrofolate reductase